jgi:hypothetical protein
MDHYENPSISNPFSCYRSWRDVCETNLFQQVSQILFHAIDPEETYMRQICSNRVEWSVLRRVFWNGGLRLDALVLSCALGCGYKNHLSKFLRECLYIQSIWATSYPRHESNDIVRFSTNIVVRLLLPAFSGPQAHHRDGFPSILYLIQETELPS